MASKQMLAVLAIVATLLPAIAMATEFVVGDGKGWALGVNYTEWAQGKEFKVVDALVFKYTSGNHNVFKVGGQDFQECNKPAASVPLTSGNDVIPLASPGRKWYICGVGNHCRSGQKLVITVQSEFQAPGSSPSIAPASFSSTKIPRSMYQNLIVAVVAVMTIIF